MLAALLLLTAWRLPAQDDLGPLEGKEAERFNRQMLSAYVGTPQPVVEKMLELAQPRPEETLYDLGSGDGRILITAAQKYGVRAVGIELDPRLYRLALQKVHTLALSPQVQVIEGDVLEQDLSAADVVTIYMTPYAMQKLRPHLEKYLRDGARVVVWADEIPGWKPTRSVTMPDAEKQPRKITLYVISKPSRGASFSKFGRTQ